MHNQNYNFSWLKREKFLNKESFSLLSKNTLKAKRILIIGGKNSGKTTFANILVDFLAENMKPAVLLPTVEGMNLISINRNKTWKECLKTLRCHKLTTIAVVGYFENYNEDYEIPYLENLASSYDFVLDVRQNSKRIRKLFSIWKRKGERLTLVYSNVE